MIRSELGLTRQLFPMVPNHIFEMVLTLHYKITKQIGVFIRARLLEALTVGFVIGAGLQILGFPFAILIGVFASITNLIPYIGPLIGGTPVVLIGLANGYNTSEILLAVGVIAFAQLLDSMVLIPTLVARIVNLHPITVIVIILAGAQFMGILGMIISIPIANALKVTANAVYNHVIENI